MQKYINYDNDTIENILFDHEIYNQKKNQNIPNEYYMRYIPNLPQQKIMNHNIPKQYRIMNQNIPNNKKKKEDTNQISIILFILMMIIIIIQLFVTINIYIKLNFEKGKII